MGSGLNECRNRSCSTPTCLIDFLRGYDKATSFVTINSKRIMASAVVVAELFAGVRGGTGGAEHIVLENLLALFRVVPVNDEIAPLGGLYKRDYGKSHGISLADAIIAATATAEDAALKTLNVKHYPMFTELEPVYRK